MNHPLLPGKSKWITSSGQIFYLLFVILCTLVSLDVSAQCSAVITVVKNSKVVEDQNPDFCEGGSLTLTAWVKGSDGQRYDASAYRWSNGATSKSITIAEEGRFTVEVTDNSGNKCTAYVDVTKRFQAQKPIIYVDGKATSGIVEICDNSSVRLSVPSQADVVYVWEKDGIDIAGAGNSREYTASETGKYTVRVSNTCGSIRSDPVELKITAAPEKPKIEASGPLKFCQGGFVKLTVPEVDGITYTWKRNGTVWRTVDNTNSISTDVAGTYTVEVSNTCGSTTSSGSVTVEVLAPITPQAQDVEVCINNNATLKATGGTAGNYRWYTGKDDKTPDPSRRDDTYVTQVLTQDASFWVAIYNGACEGPRKEIKVTVSTSKVTNKPTITVNGPTKFCKGGSVQMRVPAITGINYQWVRDGEFFGTDSNVQTVSESGEYTVILLDACGNVEAENRIVVDVLPFPDPPVAKDSYSCNPSAFTLKASGGAEGEYRWYNSQNNPTPYFGENGSTYTTTYLESNTTFWVSVMRDGCESPRVPVKAVISGPPVAYAGPDVIINPGESVALLGNGDGSYEWSPATGLNNPNSQNPIASPTKTTTYTLRVSRGADCVGTDEVTVVVREPLGIPNAFSPNGDGTNDNWVIENMDTYPDARVEIFNRWGSKVYDKVGYQNDWNGTYRGSPLPVGVYFYVILLPGGHKMTGSVSIVH